jgi:hypothetical protein
LTLALKVEAEVAVAETRDSLLKGIDRHFAQSFDVEVKLVVKEFLEYIGVYKYMYLYRRYFFLLGSRMSNFNIKCLCMYIHTCIKIAVHTYILGVKVAIFNQKVNIKQHNKITTLILGALNF